MNNPRKTKKPAGPKRVKRPKQVYKGLDQEAMRLAKENALIAEIGRIISSTLNIEEVYEKFAAAVKKLIPFDQINITFIDQKAGKVNMTYSSGIKLSVYPAGGSAPLAGTLNEIIARTQKSFLLNDDNYQEFARRFPIILKTYQAGIRSAISVPLLSKDQVIGSLTIRSYFPDAYTQKDVNLMEKVGLQIAGAIANAQLFHERERVAEILREREEKYRTLLETMEESYSEVDLKGNFTFVNDSFCKMYRGSREELIGTNYTKFFNKEEAQKLYQQYNKLYNTGQPVKTYEWEFMRMDGTQGFIETSVYLIRNAQGERIGFRGISRDVTERKKAEDALREREEKYRTLLETMEEGYFEMDLKGNLIFMNDALCKMGRLPREEMLGMPYTKYTSQEMVQKALEIYSQVYNTGKPMKLVEWEIKRRDGSTYVIESSFYLVRNAQGQPIGFRGIVRDITERKEAEKALREREEKYRTLLETMQEGYFEVDLRGNFTLINDSFCEIYRGSRDELIGLSYKQYMNKEDAPKIFKLFNQVYNTGQPVKLYEYKFISLDGKEGVIEGSAYLIRNRAGEPIGFRGIARDVTERKRAEELLQEREEKYRTLLENMEEGYFEVDLRGNFILVNDSLCKIFRGSRDALMGLNYKKYSNQEEAQKLYKAYNQVYNTGQPVELIGWEFTRMDGARGFIESSVYLMRNAQGEPIGFRGILRDITERKHIEEILQEREERFRQVAENAGEWIWEINPEGLYTYASPIVEKILGYKPEELVGKKHFYDFFDPEAKEEGKKVAFASIQKRESFRNFLNLNLHKDGHVVYLETTAAPIIDKKGTLLGYRGVDTDVTERKRAEEEREKMILDLQDALANIKTLRGMLPICASCKKIRDDKGYWSQIELYIRNHSEVEFSHGICPECQKKLYPDLYSEIQKPES
jgi:PAS domain S-box-containing protein